MSLATRCTACGTIFRVVQDQLKVSDGWVRCGRCAEVFDAREQLFDLEREAPPPWPSQAQAPASALSEVKPEAVGASQADVSPASAQPSDEDDWEARRPEDGELVSSAADTPDDDGLQRDESAPASQWPEPPDAPIAPEYPGNLALDHFSDSQALNLDSLAANPDDAPPSLPSFMRDANKPRRGLSPMRRDLWTSAGVLLFLLLGLQALFHYRDALAAADPQAQIYLKQMCQVLSCEIRPLQRIDALSVEASSLTHAPGNAKHYQLAVTLRNRSDAVLALPSFDLSLTDSRGVLLARRVLGPSDFAASAAVTGKPAVTIAARSQLNLQAVLQAGDTGLVGYTVEVFYP